MEERTEDFKRGTILYPAGKWDANTPYAIGDDDTTPMVELDGCRYVLRATEETITGVAPNSEEGRKYWHEIDIQTESVEWAPLQKCFKRKTRKFIIRGHKRSNRFVRQMEALRTRECDFRVIHRCLWYGDRVPRKYRRAYGEVIRSMTRMNLRQAFCEPKLVGTKC